MDDNSVKKDVIEEIEDKMNELKEIDNLEDKINLMKQIKDEINNEQKLLNQHIENLNNFKPRQYKKYKKYSINQLENKFKKVKNVNNKIKIYSQLCYNIEKVENELFEDSNSEYSSSEEN